MGVIPPIASNTAEAYLGGDFLILFRSQTFSSTLGQAVTAEIGEKIRGEVLTTSAILSRMSS